MSSLRRMFMRKKHSGRLPYPYQEVEYIETTGTQKVAFSTAPNNFLNGDVIEHKYMYRTLNSSVVFGSYNNNISPCLWVAAQSSSANKVVCKINSSFLWSSASAKANTEYVMKIDNTQSNTRFFMNDAVVSTPKQTVTFTNTYSVISTAQVFYYHKHTRNGIVLNEYIPCYDKTDPTKHTAGVYDIVNNQFYGNTGTDYFIVGPDVTV